MGLLVLLFTSVALELLLLLSSLLTAGSGFMVKRDFATSPRRRSLQSVYNVDLLIQLANLEIQLRVVLIVVVLIPDDSV